LNKEADLKIIMLGAPGAGKGTQAMLIAEKYHIPHVSTGDIFRANLKQGTPLGVEAKKFMDLGQLVPDDLTVKLLLHRVSEEDCKKGYVLDGFPRTLVQAKVLDEALQELGQSIDLCINVDVDDESIMKRMSGRRACVSCGATYHVDYLPPKNEGVCDICGQQLILREDDTPETVKNRLTVYHDQTQPLVEFYTQKNVLFTVDGKLDKDDVFAAITKRCDTFL
jgi:adenylate kinase